MDELDGYERRGGRIGAWVGRQLRAAMLPTLFLAFCGYFAWHAQHGERGLIAERARTDQIRQARTEQAQVMRDLEAWERRVEGLRGERLDRDQLDERARQLLNMVGRDEIVIPYGPGQRLF